MPHETSGMRVTLDAETFPKVETALGLLAETVFVIAGKTRDVARQGYIDPASQMTTVHLPLNSRGDSTVPSWSMAPTAALLHTGLRQNFELLSPV